MKILKNITVFTLVMLLSVSTVLEARDKNVLTLVAAHLTMWILSVRSMGIRSMPM